MEDIEKNSWDISKILLIIFILISLVLGGYIIYDKGVVKNKKPNEPTEIIPDVEKETPDDPEEPIETVKTKPVFRDGQIDEFISSIAYLGSTVGASTSGDAYSGSLTAIDNIDKRVLVVLAFRNLNIDFEEGTTTSKINSVLKKRFNYEIDDFPSEVKISGYSVKLNGDKYEPIDGVSGNYGYDKITKNSKYYFSEDDLIIEEDALFTDGLFVNSDSEYHIFKNTKDLYEYKNYIETVKYVCERLDEDCDSSYARDTNDIKSTYTKFKHIFKENNGNYYWYSTEVID